MLAREGQPEGRPAAGLRWVEDEVAAHRAHQGARDVQPEAAAVAAGAAGVAALEPPEQPRPVAVVEAAAVVRDGRPQGPLFRVGTDLDRDRARRRT